jgi:hypothetical protein
MSDDRTLEDVVVDYLQNHPDFLEQRPDALVNLDLTHRSGGAVSLIERQVEMLRIRNAELEKQLASLVRVATENAERSDFFTQLGNRLLNDFNADILQICLFDAELAAEAGEDVAAIEADDPEVEAFAPLLQRENATCGRLNESKMNFLFGSKARWVQSVALVPLGENGELGMMAIGSSDQARFYPGMGTLFLDLLAEVIAARLSLDAPEEQRRTA